MDVRCEKALRRLWEAEIYEGAGSPGLDAARRHLAECEPCRAWMRRDEVLAGRLRDLRLASSAACPDSVRAAIMASLSDEAGAADTDAAPGFLERLAVRRKHWPPWVEGVLAASLAGLLIAGGLALSHQLDSDLRTETILADFHRSALPELAHNDVSEEELTAFYAAQFGSDGPQFVLDAPVRKVAVCDLEGRKGAMIEYEWEGRRLVYYQVPRQGNGGTMAEGLRTSRENGLTVTRWSDPAYDYVLVGSAPSEELEALVRTQRT